MSLGRIIAKLFGKSKPQKQEITGWGGWLDTPEGKAWEALSEVVYNELETAKANVHKRRIIWRDGAKLCKITINQVAKQIAEKTGNEAEAVNEHVMMWLEEAAESDNPDRDDDIEFRDEIAKWIDEIAAKSLKNSPAKIPRHEIVL